MEFISSFHLHPILVHFSIVLLLTGLALEIFSWIVKKEKFHEVAFVLYVIGVAIVMPLAVQAGQWEAARLNLHHPIFETHEHFGLATFWVGLTTLPILFYFYEKNKKVFRILFLFSMILLGVLVLATGFYGGKMVYEYGVGVEL